MFEEICGRDGCVCKGYPDPNTREALLRSGANLQQCVSACNRRRNCLGVEYWQKSEKNDWGRSPNCFICPADPRKRKTVSAVSVGVLAANVYIKQNRVDLFGKFFK